MPEFALTLDKDSLHKKLLLRIQCSSSFLYYMRTNSHVTK